MTDTEVRKDTIGVQVVRFGVDIGIGTVLCSVVGGVVYFAFTSAVPRFGLVAVIASVLVGLVPFHFAICGVGKVHYQFGSLGYAWKFLLVMLLAFAGGFPFIGMEPEPTIGTVAALVPALFVVYFAGRGVRRTLGGTLNKAPVVE